MSYAYYNYIDLGIVSVHIPFTTHLWWEHSTYGLILVDSINQDELWISTNKGYSWDQIDLSDNTNSYKIQAGWLDGNDLWLVMCDNDGTADDFEVCYIELDDFNDCNPIAVSTGSSVNSVYVSDIFIISGIVYVFDVEYRSPPGDKLHCIWQVDGSPLVLLYQVTYNAAGSTFGPGIVVDQGGGDVYYFGTFDGETEDRMYLFYFLPNSGFSETQPFGNGYEIADDPNVRGLIYVSPTNFQVVYKKIADGKHYLVDLTNIDPLITGTLTEIVEQEIAVMLKRNINTSNDPPNNLGKGFLTGFDKIYQIPLTYNGKLNLISVFNFTDDVVGITNNFVIDKSGNMSEYINLLDHILNIRIYHYRQNAPYVKMKFNSNHISIVPSQFFQIIGPYTVDGSTTPNQVVFEGRAENPTEGVIQYVEINNEGIEMDERKPLGSKSGDSDAIITDINNDGAPNGPAYIRDGTLASGSAMGTLEFTKSKTLRKVYDDFAEHESFLWALRPTGILDYNAGGIDSGADIRYDGSTYFDPILQIKAWKLAKYNQIIVNGSIDPAGGLFSGQWDDLIDQGENGINSITIEDAQLNTDVLCKKKADIMGANESIRIRARFKFRKITYGFIQPGQTLTFKYVIPNFMTISEAQYIIDKMILDLKTEVGYAEISSGL